LFPLNLKRLGATVLGLADEPYDNLRLELKDSLTEYYRVGNMLNYDELLRAFGYFTYRYGKLDRIDSHNEYWLETEARLRTDFNISGIQNDIIARIKRKSLMKKTYIKAGVPVARGRIVKTIADANQLIEETGYPVVAKPDIGVGAAKTYKIHNKSELSNFFAHKPDTDYFMEEFVDGVICSFDGLADRQGQAVFCTGHQFNHGVMEAVNDDLDMFYYSYRELPQDLKEAGLRVLRAFDVRERFFHFEFFRRYSDRQILALEVNVRPPGGLTTDMFNYANDIDVYSGWAQVVVNNQFPYRYTRPYHCAYIGRKSNHSYAYTHEAILAAFPGEFLHSEPMNGLFRASLGDYGYLVRSPDLDKIQEIAAFIQQPAK
jgi:biotin carboxylase